MSAHKSIDKICIIALIVTLLITVLFMNGEKLGVQVIAADSVPDDPALAAEMLLKTAGQVDLIVTTGGVSGSSTVEFYKWIYQADESGVIAGAGFKDETLNALMAEASSTKSHTQENVDKLHDYLVEECYRYTPITFCQINMWRTDSGIVDMALDYNLAPRLGSCTYTWNK